MQHKWMVLLAVLVLFSGLLMPAGGAQAQSTAPVCPPYEDGILEDKAFLETLSPECVRTYKEEARADGRKTPPAPSVDMETKVTGGPDAFGYTYNDAVPYGWINAATNSGLTGDDAFSAPVNLGFAFPFYGVPQTQVYFNTNGLVTFGAGSWEWGAENVPNDRNPNQFIAPFWEDLLVGAPYNTGGIYYSSGGSAPNRYFVIEWRNVENYGGTGLISFEVILHEKGDIVVQHKSLPSDYYSTVGIEDSSGYQGLQYQYGYSGLLPSKAVRFYYPTVPAARILAYALQRGGFAPLNGTKDFSIIVRNQGTLGTDRYELATVDSFWPVTYYAANGITPLTDTDGDSVIDTGAIAQGAATTVIARYRVPTGALVGESNYPSINFTSSLNALVQAYVPLYMSVPAGFASVLMDNTDGAMSFLTAYVSGSNLSKATANNYWGSDVAVAQLTNGNYFYAWQKFSYAAGNWAGNIEYALLNRQGNLVRAPARLVDNANASLYIYDREPAIAVAPNGTVGLVWRRYMRNYATNLYNHNIYFATLNAAGTLLTGPTNITNNTVWGSNSSFNIPEFGSPGIAASSDNRFTLGWTEYRELNTSTWKENVWYAVRNTAGTSVLAPTALTFNDGSWSPTFNSLTGGKTIVTWLEYNGGPYYAVINSNGSIAKPAADLGAGTVYWSPDAVQLPNGKVAVAWTVESGLQYEILNSSHNIESGPHYAANPSSIQSYTLSVTTDASSHVIMTLLDGDNYNKKFYALGDSTGAFLTLPMYYYMSGDYVDVNWNGNGIAPYQADPVISGNAGVANATLIYTGGSIIANGDGYYSFKVPTGWSGTVTPSKSGYIFSPVSRTYTNVTSDQTAQDYTATAIYSIAGTTGVGGVTLSYTDGTPKTVTSQPNGTYSFSVPANWGGTVTPTHTCFTFSPASRNYSNIGANQTAQNYTPTFSPGSGCANISALIGGTNQGQFGLLPGASTRASFSGINNGPVKIQSTNAVPLIAAERLIYKVNNVNTSFTEMMGLPNSQLDNTYWLPWYNNVDLDTQLRIANVSGSLATVTITIGGQPMGNPIQLAAGASTRVSFAGVNNGPVQIVSTQNIVAAERLIYKVNGVAASFSETMAVPNSQLDNTYWLPWYNNKDLDTQLRFANVSASPATVTITIGGQPMGNPIQLAAGASTRVSFVGVNNGPVKIVSDQNIVAAERLIYKVNNVATSFTEMMALPNSQLNTTYWLPWYNNKDLDTQLRFANVHDTQTATVHVYIGGVEMPNSPFTLLPGESTRQSFANINNGPVQIVSNVPIVAAERLIYKVNNVATSFTEMMALPGNQLDTIYWLPWYNNVDLDTQLRFGVP